MRSRFFGAASYDDDEGDEEEYDMSGFVSDQVPPKPTIVERPRSMSNADADNISYAGPTYKASSVNYAPAFVKNTISNEMTTWKPLNPLWADDAAWFGAKTNVAVKTGGVIVAMLAAYPAIRRGLKFKTGTAFIVGSTAYLIPALGFNHGLLENVLGGKHWIIEYPGKALAQGATVFVSYFLIRRAMS